MKRRLIGLMLTVVSLWACAEEKMVQLDIARAGAHLPLYVMTHPQELATVVLLPGGDAGSGKIVDGQPTSKNFLARTREMFLAEQFNVIVVFRASDLQHLEYDYRVSPAHMQEIAAAVAYARQLGQMPVWLVGTSRGTVSGTAATIALPEGSVQGLVLTSSVTSKKTGAITTQDIGKIKVPTLVVHHKNDACRICIPHEAAQITLGLKSASIKKFQMVEGGFDPVGDPCEAQHWHGFINHEKETVQLMANWIKSPQN